MEGEEGHGRRLLDDRLVDQEMRLLESKSTSSDSDDSCSNIEQSDWGQGMRR